MPLKQLAKFDQQTGMRCGLVGLVIACVGAAVAFTASAEIGYWVASAGVLLGLVGVVLHWAKNWRAILRARD